MRRERGLHELYRDNPERADRVLFGRLAEPATRRGFLRGAGLASLTTVLGAPFPFARYLPGGLAPAVLAETEEPFVLTGKEPGLVVLNDRPLCAETPPHLLDDAVTPVERFYVRDNGLQPDPIDVDAWRLTIDGEATPSPRSFSLLDLQRSFESHTYLLQLECAGNGRSEFYPPASGLQWTTGAIGCAEWTGVRLRDVLAACGVSEGAVYVGYYGLDRHTSGSVEPPISRGVPMAKALQDETLLAWAMNGEPLPPMHGFPLRLVAGGWPGSVSGKWLSRIAVRDRVHDGPKMGGHSYRVPCAPVAPGTTVPESEMCIIESMPVRSLLTYPQSGVVCALGAPLQVRGHAWAGEQAVSGVDTSIDFGATWQPATLSTPRNRLAWQRFSAEVRFPQRGYYEVWARATDEAGAAQPMVVPGWNPEGYLNNACHRIAVRVA